MTEFLPFDPAGPWVTVGVILATFVSEDLTCVAVGLLLAAGRVDWLPGLGGCLAGIVLGDLGVWLIGRLGGRTALRWRWVRRLLPDDRLATLSQTLCERGGRAVVAARFVPGTRVPLLLTAGVIGSCPYRLFAWVTVAAGLWVPLVVLSVAAVGESVVGSARSAAVGVIAAFLVLRLVPRLFSRVGRAKLQATVSVLWRWEFWPAWAFYLPLAPWYLWLSVRHRSFTVWTAANPGIPASGVVGESKADILARLPADRIVPTRLVPPGPVAGRVRVALADGWTFPLILKPDAAQRGAGVRKVHNAVDVEKYLRHTPGPVIAQPFHPGPFEAGVFYYRLPGDPTGRILSVTDKVFPVVVGDGRSTLEELVWLHPRYRMQAKTFLARHSGTHVPAAGERFPLAVAGNHCQGTLFRDGGHLVTPELEDAFDRIAQAFNGFFVGRFDVRYSSVAEFRAGRGFAIVELNGATSESTNLYDPSWSLLRAYRTLFQQWAILFRVGAANRRRGHRPISLRELYRLLRDYYRSRSASALAD